MTDSSMPTTRAMLCYIVYLTAILINDYITYFKLLGEPAGLCLAFLAACAAAFLLRGFFRIERASLCWADIAVIIGCFALYSLRVLVPNNWFDSDNYHIFMQEYPFANNVSRNYLPASAYNSYTYPLSDRAFAPIRHLLGYRLGTLPNPVIIVLFYFQTKRILALLLAGYKLKTLWLCLCAVACSASLHAFALINCYNNDLWAAPLLLEIVYILLKGANGPTATVYLCLLGGLSASLKLSNAMFVAIMAAMYIGFHHKSLRLKSVLLGVIAFMLPIAVYALNAYLQTGNPFFHLYSNIFPTPYAAPISHIDSNWGPQSALQAFIWPVYGVFNTERIGEIHVPDIMLALGYILAFAWLGQIAARFIVRRERPHRNQALLPVLIVGTHLINNYMITGYWRYIIFLAPLSGALAFQTLFGLVRSIKSARSTLQERVPNIKRAWMPLSVFAVCAALLANFCLTGYTAAFTNNNWDWIFPIFRDYDTHIRNAPYVLRDRTSGVDEGFTNDIKALAMAWQTAAFPALLGMDDTPLISVVGFHNVEAQKKLLAPYKGGGLYMMARSDNFIAVLSYLGISNYKLSGDFRRTKANFLDPAAWLYAVELEPLPESDYNAGFTYLSANVFSEKPYFEWKIPQGEAGKRNFEAYFGTGMDLPPLESDFTAAITNVYLRHGDEREHLASYTAEPGAMPSKIRLELDIPEEDCALEFAVSPIEPGAPWSVMLFQPELTGAS